MIKKTNTCSSIILIIDEHKEADQEWNLTKYDLVERERSEKCKQKHIEKRTIYY